MRGRHIKPEYLEYSKAERKYYSRIRDSANRRNIPFDLSIKDIYSLLKKQNYKCALTGVDIEILGKENAASLDRKVNSLSYKKSNIWWLHKNINNMKASFSEEYFIFLCQQVVTYNNNLKNETPAVSE